MPESNESTMTNTAAEMAEECIQDCIECNRTCMETLTHCLQVRGSGAEAEIVQLLLDCAQMCQTTADFMIRNSSRHPRVCVVCADLCGLCAVACANYRDDPEMQICADVCRRCDDSCRQMGGLG